VQLECGDETIAAFADACPHRRARLWATYQDHYNSLRGEAQEDFQRFFDEAFREAYEAQVRSLDAAHDAAAESSPRAGGRAR